ncbi:MAG: hypothetical protein WD154_00955 [Nitrosopumilaceae archaeon]
MLGYYEKVLVKVLEKNPNINTRKFISLSGIGKVNFYIYSQILDAEGYIAYRQIKNQRVWYIPKHDEQHDLGMKLSEAKVLDKRYKTIQSKVLKSLSEVKRKNVSDKIDVYGDAVVLILATLASMRLVFIYRKGKVPSYYTKFVKRLELLLKKISDAKFFSDYGFGRTAIDAISHDAERKIDKFLGIDSDKGKKVSIY